MTGRISQLFAAGRFAEADKLCRSASEIDPRDSMLPTIRGAIRLERGDLKGAIEFLSQAIALDPRNATAHFNLGATQKKLMQLEAAMASFRSALSLAGPSASILTAIGLTEMALGRSAIAAATLEEAAKRDSRSPLALLNWGEALKESGQYEKAQAAFVKALDLEPNFVEALNSLGVVYAETSKIEEAEHCYRRALSIDPHHAMVRNNLGVLLKTQERLEEALREFEAANEAAPHYAMAFFNKGGVLKQMQKSAEALAVFQKAVACRPDLAEAHLAIGSIHFECESLKEAREYYQRAVDIAPSYQALTGLGQVLVAQANWPEAETCFRRALEQWPESQWARMALGKVLLNEGKLDEAEACCHVLIAGDPYSGAAHLLLARISARKKMPEQAALHCRRAIELKPTSVTAHWSLVGSLQELGRYTEAEEVTNKLIALAADISAHTSHRMKALFSVAEITSDLSYYEQALDMAAASGQADNLSYSALLKPGLAVSASAATSLLQRMNLLHDSGKSNQRSMFYRARSVLYHETQQYAAAWRDLGQANRMVLEEMDNEPKRNVENRDRALKMVRKADSIDFAQGDAKCVPVFILGVSRSGKSTLETMLRRAPGWVAFDEYPIVDETLWDLQIAAEETDAALPAEHLADFAARFIHRCRHYSEEGIFSFTGPGQVQNVKLLGEALPGARFILVKRHETDLLFRCLQKIYRKGHLYSYAPEPCLAHIRWYGAIMDALSAKLGDRARTVIYEELVANARTIVPALWKWLGLPAPPDAEFSIFNDIGCSEPYRDFITAELS